MNNLYNRYRLEYKMCRECIYYDYIIVIGFRSLIGTLIELSFDDNDQVDKFMNIIYRHDSTLKQLYDAYLQVKGEGKDE